jgi:glycosyltransferase involved in cell wall biosynthesis
MRTLLLSPHSPFGREFGAQQRTSLLYDALSRLGETDVAILAPGDATCAIPPNDPRVRAQLRWRPRAMGYANYAHDPELTALLNNAVALEDYDVIVSRYIASIAKVALPKKVPTIVDLDDVCYRYSPLLGYGWRLAGARAKAWLRQVAIDRLLPRYSGFFFVSERDRARYAHLSGAVLPNIPLDVPPIVDFKSSGHTILFVGSLWYAPNRQGIDRFLSHSWPVILKAVPQAKLLVVGAVDRAVRNEWSGLPGVTAPGFVRDLAAAYRDCAFTIVPIHSGGGTNIKILESFAHGRACVTTRFCQQAFGESFNGDRDLCVAEDDAGLAAACVKLLGNAAEREGRARAGRHVIQSHYTRERFRDTVASLLKVVVGDALC